jgi:hypothetical protein
MIDINVPIRSSLRSGIGTVTVEFSVRFCITTWLPRRRTSANPWRERMMQTSRPERTRSLANLDLKPGYKQFGVPAPFDLRRVRRFKE